MCINNLPTGLPITFVDNTKTKRHEEWKAPPPEFFLQPWNMFYATHDANLALRNFQYDPSLVNASEPNGNITDLSSFQIPGETKVYTSHGIDTRLSPAGDHLQYHGTGILEGALSTYTLLAWGCDEYGNPYYANYATETMLTKTPAGIDIMSTSDQGVDDKTFEAIKSGLLNLGNPIVAAMANNLTKTTQDGARDGKPRITTCDDYCKSNENLKGIIGISGTVEP